MRRSCVILASAKDTSIDYGSHRGLLVQPRTAGATGFPGFFEIAGQGIGCQHIASSQNALTFLL